MAAPALLVSDPEREITTSPCSDAMRYPFRMFISTERRSTTSNVSMCLRERSPCRTIVEFSASGKCQATKYLIRTKIIALLEHYIMPLRHNGKHASPERPGEKPDEHLQSLYT